MFKRFFTVSAKRSFDMSNLPYAFHGARLKVERAKHHINELIAVLNALGTMNRDHFTIVKHPNGRESFTAATWPPEAQIISLALGDAIHNLRSALDHIAQSWKQGHTPQPSLSHRQRHQPKAPLTYAPGLFT